MAFVPFVTTVMVEMRYLADGQQVENTLYFKRDDAVTPGNMEDLADIMYTWWTGNMAPITGSYVALREVFVTDLTSPTAATVVRVSSPAEPGEDAAPALPNNVSYTITFRTNQRGRSARGRNYFIGLVRTQVDGNQITSGFATAYQAAYAAIPALVFEDGWQWVVASRYSGGAPRSEGVTFPITSVALFDATVDSQRRRLPGRGD